jgi:hypothetical protein
LRHFVTLCDGLGLTSGDKMGLSCKRWFLSIPPPEKRIQPRVVAVVAAAVAVAAVA